MGQALYRKYRSRSLDDVVGQEHITQTLQNAIKQGRISHAYLFTGPRGVGKTSVARILAHQVNGLPYDDDSVHMDIIEIDAASNRRIDEIRDLRDKVYVAPTSAKYKVYIIDEVHMLTREAFNALLKTLEEPPAHVIFILATTDAHKLPETIISRTQRFGFKPADETKLIELLRKIAKAEQFEVDDDALALIAKHGGGSFRDSVSLLDQASSQDSKIDAAIIQQLLGLPNEQAISELLELATTGSSAAELMQRLTAMYDQGYQASAIAQQLGRALRQQLSDGISSTTLSASVLDLLDQLVEVPASHDPDRALEVVLLKNNPQLFSSSAASRPKPAPQATAEIIVEAVPETAQPVKAKPAEPKTSPSMTTVTFDAAVWPEVLKALKSKYNTLYGVIRMAQPDFSESGRLRLAFGFSFHQKRINEASNKQKLTDIIYNLTGQTIEIECIVDKNAQPPKLTVEVEPLPGPPEIMPTEEPVLNQDVSTISNIFGNAELLES
jgi:DNA polymerase-3 subunit gamma/tau